MNTPGLSFAYLRYKPLAAAVNIVISASGIALIAALLLIRSQAQVEFGRNLEGIDLVVGAKGSPLQLILSAVFHADIPTGNIPLAEAEKLQAHPLVGQVIPEALGDNFQGFPIVGTEPAYAAHYGAKLQPGGRWWSQPMEAVLGAETARKSGMTPGASFTGSHGLAAGGEEHKEFPYRVVGVLQPSGTVIDRLVLTSVESVWRIHEHHHHDDGDAGEEAEEKERAPGSGGREITALLIHYQSPLAAATLPRLVNASTSLQAASPAFEAARLNNLLGAGAEALEALGGLLILLAGFGVFAGLYNAMDERRYDLALLRSFGARPTRLFALTLTESAMIALLGCVLGLALGHLCTHLAGAWLASSRHLRLTGAILLPEEAWLVLSAFALAAFAAALPALRAYRTDVFHTLVLR
ncbi:MAG: FtsX-like permease family protein [Alphaproteobacteria bacterium]|nr:FtsX-like permease family protein [Alphaproteobacteria bacterium]